MKDVQRFAKTKLILVKTAPSSPADAFAEEAVSEEYLVETSNFSQADQVKTTTFRCSTLRQGPRISQKSTASHDKIHGFRDNTLTTRHTEPTKNEAESRAQARFLRNPARLSRELAIMSRSPNRLSLIQNST